MSEPITMDARPARRSQAEAREETINQIIDIATVHFVEKGLAGARIDEIAEQSTKRKIYYYFNGKEDLYRAVLHRAYTRVRSSQVAVDVQSVGPVEALRRIAEHDVRYHAEHPEFVRLVMNENIHRGQHLSGAGDLVEANRSIIAVLHDILERGVAEGLFRADIDPIELHMTISALSFHHTSNQYTYAFNFGIDMTSPASVARRAEQVADIVLSWVRVPGA